MRKIRKISKSNRSIPSENSHRFFYKIKNKRVYVSDPAMGLVNYSSQEFIEHWISSGADSKVKEGIVLPSLNYSDYGVSGKITVNQKKQAVYQRSILKTASGFGGCNASVVYSKN